MGSWSERQEPRKYDKEDVDLKGVDMIARPHDSLREVIGIITPFIKELVCIRAELGDLRDEQRDKPRWSSGVTGFMGMSGESRIHAAVEEEKEIFKRITDALAVGVHNLSQDSQDNILSQVNTVATLEAEKLRAAYKERNPPGAIR